MPRPRVIEPIVEPGKPGRKGGGTHQFAKSPDLTPFMKSALLGIWLSGRFSDKEELAEAVGVNYDTLRHLASVEQWPTERDLVKQNGDLLSQAIEKMRGAELLKFMEESMDAIRRDQDMLEDQIKRFREKGALVKIDKDGNEVLSKNDVKTVHSLIRTRGESLAQASALLGLASLQRKADAGSGGSKVTIGKGSKVQMNLLVKQK